MLIRTALAPLLISAAGLCAYATSFKGAFLLDDLIHILQNGRIRSLSPVTDLLSGGRPIVDLTLALNYASAGVGDVWEYHAVNLIIHVLAGLTLYGIVRRSLLSRRLPEHLQAAAGEVALLVAMIWVVHPLLTQGVTYLIQRAESLMGLFYLVTLYGLIRGAGSSRSTRWCITAVAACALGMGCKAVMVTAPIAALLYDRAFLSSSFVEAVRRRWSFYVGLALTWGVLWWSGVAKSVLGSSADATVGFGFEGISPVVYALTQPGVILHYLVLSVWPNPLCLDYNWPTVNGLGVAAAPAFVLTILLGALIWLRRRNPPLAFVGAWFFLILLPTSSIIPIKDVLFEHRVYLSSAAVVVLVVLGGHYLRLQLLDRFPSRRRVAHGATALAVVLITASLGYTTLRRNKVYQSSVGMWRDVAAKRPRNARAYEQLGTALVMRGQKDEAAIAYRRAVDVDPDFVSARANLANALFETGNVEEASRQYREVLLAQPHRVEARINLGHTLRLMGRVDECIEAFQAATRVDVERTTPQILASAHFNLGSVLAGRGTLDEALREFLEAVRIRPDYEKAHFALGRILFVEGDLDAAIEHFNRTLRINPDHRAARTALGEALAVQRSRAD